MFSLNKIMSFLKDLLIFSKPEEKYIFDLDDSSMNKKSTPNEKSVDIKKEKQDQFIKPVKIKDMKEESVVFDNTNNMKGISGSLDINMNYVKHKYLYEKNNDLIIREFMIKNNQLGTKAFIIFFDGMIDRNVVNLSILQPLMTLSYLNVKSEKVDIESYIKNYFMPQTQMKITSEFDKVFNDVNYGGVGLFVDGIEVAFTADVKGWEHRQIGKPNNELVIRGSQESFNEVLRVNTALLRKILKETELVTEDIIVGKRSKTPCSMIYIKDITNENLVNEVRRRLENINIDYLISSGELEQLIEDSTFLPAQQIIATERPDRAASMLIDGHVVVIVDGSPYALIMPVVFFDMIQSIEDKSLRAPYSTLVRLIRLLGLTLSLLLPGIYIAIINFHHEMLPTDLLLAIESSREKVPFPSLVSILIMEISFELIREAGIRIPGPIGPTLGIIGALILGQAAVAANLVSPILIIVVAITGIGSFTVPDYSLGYAIRTYRFVYIIFGAIAGLMGITLVFYINVLIMVSAKSFGVPFLSPIAPKTKQALSYSIIAKPIWMNENRPDYTNTKVKEKQSKISRRWWK